MSGRTYLAIAFSGISLFPLANSAHAQVHLRVGPYGGFVYYGGPYQYRSYHVRYYGNYLVGDPYYYRPYAYASSYWAPVYNFPNDAPPKYVVESSNAPITAPAPTISQSLFADPFSSVARMQVIVPTSDARLIVNDVATTQTGLERNLVSPVLDVSRSYTYTLRATWLRDGQEMTQTQEISVRPGQHTTVVFRDANGVPAMPSSTKQPALASRLPTID